MAHYDYIIIGAGASGLLLADSLGFDDFFASKSILLIDKEVKTKNDRTWCFWEVGEGIFDHLLKKSWSQIYFAGKSLRLSTKIAPYSYKMIRAMDFYSHYNHKIEKHNNITRTTDEVTAVNALQNGMEVLGKDKNYTCEKVFNSIFSYDSLHGQEKYPVLQQHFIGWFIKTEKPVFKIDEATFMDFSIPQKGNTRFMYVLPLTETEALFEYTLFSEHLLEKEEYEKAIEAYLDEHFEDVPYTITEKEEGSIPMTAHPFHKRNTDSHMYIGVAGGWAKPSTGFTFYSTSKKVKKLTTHLKQNKPLSQFYKKDKFLFYDMLLLDVLAKNNHLGQSIFESLFKKRPAHLILKFLDNGTNIWEDIRIMAAPQPIPFVRALLRRLF
ncbi:lycopene cyclase family protein [Flagellimonas sp. S174]|uniref:lycopene cyclase family protein n=1 Tax=Flagellimonas sp. S174 TaxID=3410790 RepID=UPI003BF58DB5